MLDGLDELGEKLRGFLACDILTVLESCPQLRLLFSSRNEADLRKEFNSKRALQLQVQEHNSSDVKRYVQIECDSLVDSLQESGANQETCEQIRVASASMLQKAGGKYNLFFHLFIEIQAAILI